MNVHYEGREIEGEWLELAEKDRLIYLGPDLTLRRCTIVVRVPASRLIILPTRFIDCTIELKQEMRNHRGWVSASLKGCRLKGRMLGCDFGPFPGYTTGGEHGQVEDCDFSEARLDLCRFHGCDTRTLRFPQWPCFTILDPIGKGRELTSVKWPGSFRPVRLEGRTRRCPRWRRGRSTHRPRRSARGRQRRNSRPQLSGSTSSSIEGRRADRANLVPEGVFVPREGGVRFEPLPPPTQAEVEQLLRRIGRIEALLRAAAYTMQYRTRCA